MSRQVFMSYATPGVSAFVSDEGHQHYPRIAIYHQHDSGDGDASVTVASYLSLRKAREFAKTLLAACDAVDVDEARQRNLALALPEPTP